MITGLSFTPEFIISLASLIFLAGGFYMAQTAGQKRTDARMDNLENNVKDTNKSLNEVILSQSVNNEKITNIGEKVTRMESQNSEILKILTKRIPHE